MPGHDEKVSRFPDTRWSLVGRAAASDDETRREAMTELLRAYSPALHVFLTAGRRVPAEVADDILHDFIADRILTGKLLQRADRGKGRFRSYLLKSLSNFATTRLGRDRSILARSTEFGDATAETAAVHQDTERFDQEWVRLVVRDTLEIMEADCRGRRRDDLWEIFRARVVDPMLLGVEPLEYEELVRRFDIETPRQAINLLATAKRAFTRHLRVVVSKYVHDEEGVESEIADLAAIVRR